MLLSLKTLKMRHWCALTIIIPWKVKLLRLVSVGMGEKLACPLYMNWNVKAVSWLYCFR